MKIVASDGEETDFVSDSVHHQSSAFYHLIVREHLLGAMVHSEETVVDQVPNHHPSVLSEEKIDFV